MNKIRREDKISLRISKETKLILSKEALRKDVSLNALMNKIFDDHILFTGFTNAG